MYITYIAVQCDQTHCPQCVSRGISVAICTCVRSVFTSEHRRSDVERRVNGGFLSIHSQLSLCRRMYYIQALDKPRITTFRARNRSRRMSASHHFWAEEERPPGNMLLNGAHNYSLIKVRTGPLNVV